MLSDQKRTHPEKPTIGSMQTSPEAKALVEELQNVLRNEEAWFIAEEHLRRAREGVSIEAQFAKVVEEVNADPA